MSGKGFVRLTIIGVALYFIVTYLVAQWMGINVFSSLYVIAFEICVVIYCFSEGKYHCKYMKYTALGITMADALTRFDHIFNSLSASAHNLIAIGLIGAGIIISFYKAIKHFIRVRKLKRLQKYGPQNM